MLLGSSDVRLGCQGWSESDWDGVFYPRGLKAADRLQCYAGAFDFVEIDSTFYARPQPSTVLRWLDQTPPEFRFTAKVPQAITHDPDPASGRPRQPLAAPGWQDRLEEFAETIGLLGEKLVALLVQLPPQWHWRPDHLDVLKRFLASRPSGYRWAVEFRHRGWLNEAVFDLLGQHEVALVSQDLYYMPRHVRVTTPALAYVRLQGRRKEIVSMNKLQIERDEALDEWAEVIRQLVSQGVKTIVVAANNHYQGFSPATIAALQHRLGLPVASLPAQRERPQPRSDP